MKELRIHPKAQKEIGRLPTGEKERVKKSLKSLLAGKKEKLDIKRIKGQKGKEDLYRLRVGDYRIIYAADRKTVWIVRVAHRGLAYKGL